MKGESRTKKTMLNTKMNLICYFASFITAFFTRKILLDQLGAEFIGFTGTVCEEGVEYLLESRHSNTRLEVIENILQRTI